MMMSLDTANDDADVPRSQASLAHARVKTDILAGRRRPGDKLKINEIAQELEVSPGAIREALSRLVPEGLVVSRDQKGFVVAPLSIVDLEDLTRLRCDIEEIALRRSIEAGDAEWEGAVLAAAHRLRRTTKRLVDGQANLEWSAQHERFHSALVAACASPRLLTFRSQLHQQSERYRLLSDGLDGERNIEAEHQSLVDAAMDRDAEELVRLTRQHFLHTTALIKEAAAASPAAARERALA